MGDWAIVTGSCQGLGKAILTRLSQDFPAMRVLGVSLTAPKPVSANMYTLAADLATESGRSSVKAFIGNQPIRYLVHNAGVNIPAHFFNTTLTDFRTMFGVNVEAPFFLTQQLYDNLTPSARVLLMGSKAGEMYVMGTASYCMTKAALAMLRQVLLTDLKTVDTGLMMPGIADTPQFRRWYETIKQTHPIDLTKVLKPELIGHFVTYLLKDTTREAFRDTLWHVYDPSHHQFWVPKEMQAPELPYVPKEKKN